MALEEQWENFKDQVIPKDAPEIQLNSMRMCFYAGMIQMFHNTTIIIPTLTDEQANIMLITWERELQLFQESLAKDVTLNG